MSLHKTAFILKYVIIYNIQVIFPAVSHYDVTDEDNDRNVIK
jgi:hypothetical protein